MNRLRQVEEVFQEVADRPAHERTSVLDRLCGGDAELRAEVESLLEVDDVAARSIAIAIDREAELFSATIAWSLIGCRVGAYRLTGLLGRGGMGAVYLAVNASDASQTPVAVKLIKRGMDTYEVVRRFAEERQILSRLDHPNIARLLDGGSTDEGLPFLVMEYVPGTAITQYAKRLPLREKIDLFRTVCGAVRYAHRMLIVHRDIKPGNILVDDAGTPRLLDFGIAKLLTGEDTAMTATNARMLTPDFASPEQIRGAAVTTAMDVYSLGRVLEEMLAADDAPADLQAIVAKARHEDADQRYTSVEQLDEDLWRFLRSLPVLARKDTVAYRTTRFIRRNKVLATVTTVAFVAITAATGIAVVQHRRLQDQLQQVRNLANTMLIDVNGQLANVPGTLKVRETLVRTGLAYLDRVARESGGDPQLQWELAQAYHMIGEVQGSTHIRDASLGEFEDAAESYRTALRLAEPLLKADPTEPAKALLVANTHQTLAVFCRGKPGEIEHLREGLRIASSLRNHRGIETARQRITIDLAGAYMRRGDPHEAINILRPLTIPNAAYLLAPALAATGDLQAAIEVTTGVNARADKSLSEPTDSRTKRVVRRGRIYGHNILGNILGNPLFLNLGDTAAADREYRAALTLAERNAAWDPNDTGAQTDLAWSWKRLAESLREAAPSASVEAYLKSISLLEQLGARAGRALERHDDLGSAHWGIVGPLLRLGRRGDALEHALKSLSIVKTTGAHLALGDVRLAGGDAAGARPEYLKGLAIAEKQSTASPRMMPLRRDVADACERLAELELRSGDKSAARDWYSRSVAVWRDWPNRGVSNPYNVRRQQQAEAALAKLR